jgi:uncharacterized protein (DUF362 family)
MDRRSFLRLAAAAALAPEWIPAVCRSASETSRIACISDTSRASGIPDLRTLQRMVNRSVAALTGIDDPDEAWHSLFAPSDVVGIKVNCLAGRGISTNPDLANAIAACLHDIGIPAERIIVWDRSNRDLRSAGFKTGSAASGYRCFGTDEAGYGDKLYEQGSIGGLLSTILTSLSSAIINVPVLKDHGIAGVSMSMKNHFGSIHNPNKYHPNGGNPYIADLNSLPLIRSKQRLIICDCLNAQCNGGPAYDPRWNWREGSILAARDPVALDATGLAMIERKRAERGLPTLAEEKRYPAYIDTAGTINGLGNASADSIDVIHEEA